MKLSYEMPTKSIWGFLGLVLIFRLAYIYLVPFELVPDEAYYWDWSRQLDIGYYSKPPMVAWLNYISTSIFGINEFGVRFFAALLGTGFVGIIYLLAKEIFDEEVALLSALASLLTPGNAALSLIMTIDPPLLFFGTLSLFFLWRIISLPSIQRKNIYFVMLGLSVGLGFLSKQMMIVYFILIFVFLILNKESRPIIFSWGFLVFLIVSLMLMSLPLYWNYTHNWVTFKETAHHISSNSSIIKSIKTFFEYIGGQLLIITPIFCMIIYFAIFKGVVNFNKLDRRFKFLFIFGGIPLILFLFLSLKQRVNANWPALFYGPAVIFSFTWILKNIEYKKIEKYIDIGIKVAYIFVFLTYICPFVFTIDHISGSKIDPTVRGKGWKELALKFDPIYKKEKNKEEIFIISDRRDIISELSFYMKEHPFIYKWDKTPYIVKDQYEISHLPGKKQIGKNALIVIKGSLKRVELEKNFKKVEKIDNIKIKLGLRHFRTYTVFKGYYFLGI